MDRFTRRRKGILELLEGIVLTCTYCMDLLKYLRALPVLDGLDIVVINTKNVSTCFKFNVHSHLSLFFTSMSRLLYFLSQCLLLPLA